MRTLSSITSNANASPSRAPASASLSNFRPGGRSVSNSSGSGRRSSQRSGRRGSSSSPNGHQPHPQQPPSQLRYRLNQLEAGMPLNILGLDRKDVWRTCFCFHVRTVTIFIGVLHLVVYILWLSFIAAYFMYEPGNEGSNGGFIGLQHEHMLPTPVSISNEKMPPTPDQDMSLYGLRHDPDHDHNRNNRLDPLAMVVSTRKANSQNILLLVCNMVITLFLVYGAVRGKPSFLMPFFVLRVFDFCIFCLTMVGYFSYLPNVTDTISRAQWIDIFGASFRDYLLEMDPQLLSLLMLIIIVLVIAVKAYMIGVIWNCYKYLMLRNSIIRTVIAYRQDDPNNLVGLQQNLLPDLPDYDTAVNDPRYAKKPPLNSQSSNNNPPGATVAACSSVALPPPPPYSEAVEAMPSKPVTFSFPVPSQENLTTVAQPDPETPHSSHIDTSADNALSQDVVETPGASSIAVAAVPLPHTQDVTEIPVISVLPAKATADPSLSN